MKSLLLAIVMLVSCGGTKDPSQAALDEFRAFASATYPGGAYKQNQGTAFTCNVTKVDVLRSTSVSSPFAGVIEAQGTETLPGEKSGIEVRVHTVFTKDGHGWTCDPTQSTYEDITNHQPPQPDASCGHLDMCLGKPAAMR